MFPVPQLLQHCLVISNLSFLSLSSFYTVQPSPPHVSCPSPAPKLSSPLLLLKSDISKKLSHIESWFFVTVYSKQKESQTVSLVYIELKGQLGYFSYKSFSFNLVEKVKYKFDELKIKYGTKPGDMLLVSLFSYY